MAQRRDGTTFRRERIREVEKMVKKELERNGGNISLKKFLASVDYSLGLTPRKTREYLNTLVDLEMIDVGSDADFITYHRPKNEIPVHPQEPHQEAPP